MALLILAALPFLGLAHSPALKPTNVLEPKLMRRQAEDEELARDLGMRVGSNGEFVKYTQTEVINGQAVPVLNYCDMDFLFGSPDVTPTACLDAQYDNTINEMNMCGIAGYRHRASVTQIPDTDKEKRPRGCFKAPCSYLNQIPDPKNVIQEAPFLKDDLVTAQFNGAGDRINAQVTAVDNSTGRITIKWEDTAKTADTEKDKTQLHHAEEKCFYFNAYQTEPNGPVTGTPVCERERYSLGKQDKTPDRDGLSGGCKAEFSVIMDEDLCAAAAKCQGFCTEVDFIVSRSSPADYNKYPLGCFVHNPRPGFRRCIAFNPPLDFFAELPTGVNGPVRGTPLCNTTRLGR
jgi:hypothetical protein